MAEKEFTLFEMRSEQFVKDIKAKVKQKPGDIVIDVPPLEFRIDITVDGGFYDKLKADPRLQEVMRENLKPTYQNLVQTLAAMFDLGNARIWAHLDDPVAAYEKALSESQDKIQKATDAMVKSAMESWKQYFKDQKEYLKYQVKIAAKLTIGTLSLAANIALLASTPFSFGVGTVFGIIGMAKTTTAMIKIIKDSLKDAEEVLIEAWKVYNKLTDAGKKNKELGTKLKLKAYAAEAANGICEAVISISPMPSLNKLKDRLELSHNKILGINKDLVNLSQKINKKLEKIDKVQEAQKKKITGVELTEKELKYSKKNLDKLEADLAKLLKDNDKLQAQYKVLCETSEVLTKWFQQLVAKNKDLKVFGWCMEKLSMLYDVGTSFADFNGGLSAILNVVVGVGGVLVDKAADQAIETAINKSMK